MLISLHLGKLRTFLSLFPIESVENFKDFLKELLEVDED